MLVDVCDKAGFVIRIFVKLIKLLHIAVPILLIVLISYDLFKAFTSQLDDKTKKDAIGKAVKRFIFAVIVFLIPTILTFIFKSFNNLISKDGEKVDATSVSWLDCWLSEYTGTTTRDYGGSSFDPAATSSPTPTATPACSSYRTLTACVNADCHWYNESCHTFATPTPIPECSFYDKTSSCLAAGCYWYDNLCHKESNMGCCYKEDGVWKFESNEAKCEHMGYRTNVLRNDCLNNNNISETPAPNAYFDDDSSKQVVGLYCSVGPIQAINTYEGSELYIRSITQLDCQPTEDGTIEYKSDNYNIVNVDQSTSSVSYPVSRGEMKSVSIAPISPGTTKVIITFTPNDTSKYKRNSVDLYVKVPNDDE